MNFLVTKECLEGKSIDEITETILNHVRLIVKEEIGNHGVGEYEVAFVKIRDLKENR
jgi:hypothetical protein